MPTPTSILPFFQSLRNCTRRKDLAVAEAAEFQDLQSVKRRTMYAVELRSRLAEETEARRGLQRLAGIGDAITTEHMRLQQMRREHEVHRQVQEKWLNNVNDFESQ